VQSVQQTSDGGYILAGGVYGPMPGFAFLVKTDSDGQLVWQNAYPTYLIGLAVTETADGYVFAGRTSDIPGKPYQPVLVKTDGSGTFEWEKVFSFSNGLARDVKPVSGGFVVACSAPTSGVLVKTDASG